MKKKDRVKRALLCLSLGAVLLLSGCGESAQPNEPSGSSAPTAGTSDFGPNNQPSDSQVKAYATSSAENDTDVGLRNIKIDTAALSLSESQKEVMEYFDDDYFSVPSYEFLRRYPNVFQGTQMHVWGTVVKVISMDSNQYELVLWVNVGPVEYEYSWAYPEYEGAYVLLAGKTGASWYMQGDTLDVYGRYISVETIEIDGTSYTIPKLNVYNAYYDTDTAPNDLYRYIEKFDVSFIKRVVSSIFGDDIEVRLPIVGVDITQEQSDMWSEVIGHAPCYTVELEDQSNAKFKKFFFYTDTSNLERARIQDAKDALAGYTGIDRSIEFAADFEHFFFFTYDQNLRVLTLEYYDSSFNKIWKREFTETVSAQYDYTKNNVYLVANNELYIINVETGEDTFPPSYVGEKVAVRKMSDGILLISPNQSDGIMKVDLKGSILWRLNLKNDVYSVDGLQVLDDRLVFAQYYWESAEDYGTRYLVIDNHTGDVLTDAVSIS